MKHFPPTLIALSFSHAMTCTKYLIWVLELFDLIRHNIGLGPIKTNSNIIHDMHQDAMLSDELELAPPPPPGAH